MPKRFLLFILVILSACEGCEKADPKPLTELEKLPPATQEGKYTFGCLVNGKAVVTKSTLDAVAIYQEGVLTIGGSLKKTNEHQSIAIVLNEQASTIDAGEYELTSPPFTNAGYSRYDDDGIGCYYLYDNTISGKLTLTKFDKINFIISGLFEFTTLVAGCDTVKITDGRFDIKYIP